MLVHLHPLEARHNEELLVILAGVVTRMRLAQEDCDGEVVTAKGEMNEAIVEGAPGKCWREFGC